MKMSSNDQVKTHKRFGRGRGIRLCLLAVVLSLISAQGALGQKMYLTDNEYIKRANLDGTDLETLVSGLGWPFHIALDVSAGKMYWADAVAPKIQRANLDGGGVEDLVTTGLDFPAGIALDLSAGKMYWADAGAPKIQRAND
jgi:low density lipoprotein receptor-related protein 5/6